MLKLVPVSLSKANEFVKAFHRHHKPVVGHKFSIGCSLNGRLVGVVIVGRPISRYLDDGTTLEITRLCTLGVKNTCSMLYAAAARAAKALGYTKIITYILESENGNSLKAANWYYKGIAGGKEWSGTRKPPNPLYPQELKKRYEKYL